MSACVTTSNRASSKPLEQHLAGYLLGLARGNWTLAYNRECLALWRECYGEQIAARAEKLVKAGWKK
ncbi:MAG: hypothetical protein WC023_01635 [Rhodocyclaceae bacterium]